jgi:hypothetical protein
MRIRVEPHTQIDKSFVIELGKYAELRLAVDYDDVDHATVDKMVKRLVSVIKEHWTEEE